MGMVRAAGEDLLEELAETPLTGLAKILGIDIDDWLPVASSPLPITMRLTPRRHDMIGLGKCWNRLVENVYLG